MRNVELLRAQAQSVLCVVGVGVWVRVWVWVWGGGGLDLLTNLLSRPAETLAEPSREPGRPLNSGS